MMICRLQTIRSGFIGSKYRKPAATHMTYSHIRPGLAALTAAACLLATSVQAQRQMESLGRGVVALRMDTTNVYVGWRLLGTDPDNIGFNLYRVPNGGAAVKVNSSLITNSCNYVDSGATLTQSNAWFVRPMTNGVEWPASRAFGLPANPATQPYFSIPLQIPPGGVTPDTNAYTYSANDCSAGDLDGDGEYEIVLKWDPSNSKDNAQSGYTGNVLLDAYKMDGTRLWRIDLGRNIRAGAHYTQFMVYDLDGDGKAEVACKTAPGTVDGQGNNVILGSDDPNADYRTTSGYILSGPEYLTIFNGQTGAALVTTNYVVPRGNVSDWGDGYGNRVDRFLACVAYLDGVRPSLVMCRGYYTRAVLAAWDWRNGQLTQRWVFDSTNGYSSYEGQGNHNLSVGDVDGDGKDEIVYGACSIDDNGAGLYTTGLAHGDAMHLSDMDPDRPGLEVWDVHEVPSSAGGGELRDAATGQLIFGCVGTGDTGRGMASHIDPAYRGFQVWSSATDGTYDHTGVRISPNKPSVNFALWWDADLCRELLDGTSLDKWTGNGTTRLVSFGSYGSAVSINGTKSNPSLSADLLGDWREEAIFSSSDSSQLLVFVSTTMATNRFYTLMHDPQYRLSIAWQNVAYNQPPHTSFYIGEDMLPPPLPPVSDAKLVWRGGNGTNTWDVGTTTNWSVNGIWTNTVPAIFNQGDAVLFDLSGSNNVPVSLTGALSPGKVTVYAFSPKDYVFGGSGSLAGSMKLVKDGTDALTVNTTNSYTGGTAINRGTLTLGAQAGAGTGLLSLNGGTLALNASGNPAVYSNALNITAPSSLTSPGSGNINQALAGTWSGNAPLSVNIGAGGTLSAQGDMTGFGGRMTLTVGGIFQFAGSGGSRSAAFDLGSAAGVMQTRDGGTIQLGSLAGRAGSILRGAGSTANPTLYLIGTNNASTTMSGTIANGLAGAGATTSLIKVGTGIWTLSGINTHSGTTTVSNGMLLINGSLAQSPVTVAGGSRVGGSGRLGQGLVVQAGGSVIPGSDTNLAGTLTVSNSLSELGGVVNYFDLSDDPTGTIKTNDLINVVDNLTLAGTNTIQANLPDGPLPIGVYPLFKYTGTLVGGLSNLVVNGAFAKPVILTNPPGMIALVVTNVRAATNLTWTGDGAANQWNEGISSNWSNGASLDRFYTLDRVRFDAAGSANPTVELVGKLQPASVVVDAAGDFTFRGAGFLSVPTGLTKTNSGTLTVLTTNDYTGTTIIGGGVLAISNLVNGGLPGAIGASDNSPGNLVFNGGALRYLGASASVDRGATFNSGGGTIEVTNSGAVLTLNGAALVGEGRLTKSGSGTLTLNASNSYSGGTILRAGTLRLGSDDANRYALGTGTVTFSNNAILQMYGYGANNSPTYGTLGNNLVVPAGQSGTLLTPPRCDVAGTLTGAGTLNLVWDYVRMNQSGNWSAFTGLITIRPRSGTAEYRLANSSDLPNAALNLSNGITFYHTYGDTKTVDIGELAGDSGATLGPGNGNSSNPTWRVGAKNTSATFAGRIINAGTTAVTKVGSGTWTLTGTNTYTGTTTVSAGTLLVNGSHLSATNTVTVASGATLGGTGTLGGATTVNGKLSPGNNAIGTLTFTNTVTLNSGGTTHIEIQKSPKTNDLLRVLGRLTYGGALSVTNLAGTLTNGDSFKLLDATNYTGAFATLSLPALGSGLAWNTNALYTNGTLSVVMLPRFNSVGLVGTNLVMSGNGGLVGSNYYVLTSTNLVRPLAQWTPIATNQFVTGGSFNFTNGVNSGTPQRFYLLQAP